MARAAQRALGRWLPNVRSCRWLPNVRSCRFWRGQLAGLSRGRLAACACCQAWFSGAGWAVI